jgi:hypothetical protein
MLASAVLVAMSGLVRAADDPKAVVDKGIKALGGEDKLAKAKVISWKSKGKIFIQGNANDFTLEATAEGLTNYRSRFEGDFGGQKIEGIGVLNADKGWRTFPDNSELDAEHFANQKRDAYLQVLPITLVGLKEKTFKLEADKEEQVDGKPAVGIKVTGPDKKEFTIFFDKESGLPVKLIGKVVNFMDQEVTQETTFSGYKDFDGIKKATKIETKHDGEKLIEAEVTEFKVSDNVDPKTFAKPD